VNLLLRMSLDVSEGRGSGSGGAGGGDSAPEECVTHFHSLQRYGAVSCCLVLVFIHTMVLPCAPGQRYTGGVYPHSKQ